MTKLEKLLQLAEDENIIIHYTDYLPYNLGGLYVEIGGVGPIINILNSIKDNHYEFIEVLAEELGHYFTSAGDSLNNVTTYTDKLNVCRCERKALKWACNFLVTKEDLVNALEFGCKSYYEFSEYIGVSEEIIKYKFELLALVDNQVKLGKYYIILSNLPNIYIYKEI